MAEDLSFRLILFRSPVRRQRGTGKQTQDVVEYSQPRSRSRQAINRLPPIKDMHSCSKTGRIIMFMMKVAWLIISLFTSSTCITFDLIHVCDLFLALQNNVLIIITIIFTSRTNQLDLSESGSTANLFTFPLLRDRR